MNREDIITDRTELGQVLKNARLDAGISRRGMALRLGIADFYPSSSIQTLMATIYFWEKGQYSPRSEILLRYTERFGVKIPSLNNFDRRGETAYREACEERKKNRVTEATFYLPGNRKLVVKYGENGEELSQSLI